MKEVLDLIRRESSLDPKRMVLLSSVSSIATTGMLGIISYAAEKTAEDGVSILVAMAFLCALLAHVVAQRSVLAAVGEEIEVIVNRLRIDMADQIRTADLSLLNQIGRGTLFAVLTRHTRTISQTLSMLTFGAQQIVLIVFAGLYLAWLAPLAFVVTAGFSAVVMTLHAKRMAVVREDQKEAEAAEAIVAENTTELAQGAKEIRMNTERADALTAVVKAASADAGRARTRAKKGWNGSFVRMQAIFYALIGVTVFVVPLFTDSYHDAVIKVTTTMLFLIGPIGSLAQSLYNVDEARSAIKAIQTLRDRLNEACETTAGEAQGTIPEPRETITLENVTFSYPNGNGRAGFTLGPLSLTLRADETVFVTGGNGSGKSTLLMLLTGLIKPDTGRILVDGVPVEADTYQAYRDRIAAVFYDYHLFRHFYGIGQPDPEQADRLLHDLEIDDKVEIGEGAFSTVALSSGQRKRLALAAAELENKPMLLLDEWAADQDPVFRRKFYGEILDAMVQRHRFRLLVTHDDRWFDRAGRVLQLVDGKLNDITGEPNRWAIR